MKAEASLPHHYLTESHASARQTNNNESKTPYLNSLFQIKMFALSQTLLHQFDSF